jgi:hypothetical protein
MAIGGMTVATLEATMGVGEFARWQEYEKLEPFGAIRDNWHMGTLAALYMQVHGKPGRKVSADDFMYRTIDEQRDRQTRQTIQGLIALAKPKATKGKAKRRRTKPQTKGGD